MERATRAILEGVGVAVLTGIGIGFISMFEVHERQKHILENLRSLEMETQRQWAQIFALKDDMHNTTVDVYRIYLNAGLEPIPRRTDRAPGHDHKPEK